MTRGTDKADLKVKMSNINPSKEGLGGVQFDWKQQVIHRSYSHTKCTGTSFSIYNVQ